MKFIRYILNPADNPSYQQAVQDGDDELVAQLSTVRQAICLQYSEKNLEYVKQVAIDGQYDIVEFTPPSTHISVQDDTDALLVDHEYRLTLLELGITE